MHPVSGLREARRHVGSRCLYNEKRIAHHRDRQAERGYLREVLALLPTDPDIPNHPSAEARIVDGADPARCLAETLEFSRYDQPWTPTRCIYARGHAAHHSDGCIEWTSDDPLLGEADEPRRRTPRAFTGWDIW